MPFAECSYLVIGWDWRHTFYFNRKHAIFWLREAFGSHPLDDLLTEFIKEAGHNFPAFFFFVPISMELHLKKGIFYVEAICRQGRMDPFVQTFLFWKFLSMAKPLECLIGLKEKLNSYKPLKGKHLKCLSEHGSPFSPTSKAIPGPFIKKEEGRSRFTWNFIAMLFHRSPSWAHRLPDDDPGKLQAFCTKLPKANQTNWGWIHYGTSSHRS